MRYRGRLRSPKRVGLTIGAGRLTVKLTSRSVRGCRLTVASAREVLLPSQRRNTSLTVSARVPAGNYVIGIGCTRAAARPYRLSISAAPPQPADE